MKKIGVALLGLGTVGGGTYRILKEMKEDIMRTDGVEIEVMHILERDIEKAKALGIDPSIVSTDINNVVNNPEIKIVADHILKTREKLNRILAENTGRSIEEIARDTERDNYLTAQKAMEYGLIDKVLGVNTNN